MAAVLWDPHTISSVWCCFVVAVVVVVVSGVIHQAHVRRVHSLAQQGAQIYYGESETGPLGGGGIAYATSMQTGV